MSRDDCDKGLVNNNTTRIATWLQDHPINPAEYEFSSWRAVTTTNKRKGSLREAVEQKSRLSSKRARLKEITGNTMSDPEKASSRPLSQPSNKRKRSFGEETTPLPADDTPVYTLPFTPRESQRASHGTLFDEDATPRAPILSDKARSETTDSPIGAGDRQSEMSTTSSTSVRTRSQSPTKHIGDFQLSNVRVELKDFGTKGYPVPAAAKTLYQQMRRISKGLGVVPRVFEDEMLGLDEVDLIDDTNFEDVESETKRYDVGTKEKRNIFWHDLQKLHAAARECHNEGLSEPEWNGEVHSRVLRLALESSRDVSRVWYRNVTINRIRDNSLLPTKTGSSAQSTAKMQSKMVDYVMILEPDERLDAGILRVLKEGYPTNSRASINPIEDPLRFKPLAISIETKRAAIQEDTAHVQLSLWVTAHFAKLRQIYTLCSKYSNLSFELPILPLIVVQGHSWKLLIACSSTNSLPTSPLSSPTSSVIILREINIGTTATLLGCFVVLAALEQLGRWVEMDFKKWWTDCLGIE